MNYLIINTNILDGFSINNNDYNNKTMIIKTCFLSSIR